MLDHLRRSRRGVALILVGPALAVLAVLVLGPLLQQAVRLVAKVVSPQAEFDGAVFATFPWLEWTRALGVQVAYLAAVLAIELPAGLALAVALPRRGALAGLAVVACAVPLLAGPPVLELLRTQFVPRALDGLTSAAGWPTVPALPAQWFAWVLVDAWRYVPLVALLAWTAVPPRDDLDAAARIDGLGPLDRLRFVHGPRVRAVLGAVLVLRIADTFAAWPHGDSPSLARFGHQSHLSVEHAGLASLATLLALLLLLAWPLRAAQRGGAR